jgi:cation:H+ antiporter
MPFEMNMFLSLVLLPAGLLLLIKGADFLVDGAVAIAERLGVSPLVIGLTIVAMGTSAPEIASSITLALTDRGDGAIGNVYGSNIANLFLVGGICAIIRPICIRLSVLKREMPVMVGVALLLFPILYNMELTRVESVVLLAVFAGLICYTVVAAMKEGKRNPEELAHADEHLHETCKDGSKSMGVCLGLIGVGLVGLAVGANMTVESAVFLGQKAGMTEAVIGLTIIAIGTSLPELMTCVVAAMKGHDDLSVGNLVGSNVFNTLLVIGSAGAIKPFALKEAGLAGIDYWVMVGVSIMFVSVSMIFKKINKAWGIAFAVGYFCYIGYLISRIGA